MHFILSQLKRGAKDFWPLLSDFPESSWNCILTSAVRRPVRPVRNSHLNPVETASWALNRTVPELNLAA
ncbi:MAG: hypothetical protein CME33_05360 [Gimesia sp.]|nr:hypothetical protein [Gimesia sp.]